MLKASNLVTNLLIASWLWIIHNPFFTFQSFSSLPFPSRSFPPFSNHTVNIVNEKLYLVLWFWLLFLGCFTIIFLAIRLIYFSVPALRNSYLHVHAPSLNKSIGYRLSRSTGPWFVTRFLISHMKPCNFADLMEIVYRKHFELNLEQRRRWLG